LFIWHYIFNLCISFFLFFFIFLFSVLRLELRTLSCWAGALQLNTSPALYSLARVLHFHPGLAQTTVLLPISLSKWNSRCMPPCQAGYVTDCLTNIFYTGLALNYNLFSASSVAEIIQESCFLILYYLILLLLFRQLTLLMIKFIECLQCNRNCTKKVLYLFAISSQYSIYSMAKLQFEAFNDTMAGDIYNPICD
jgi:hypothetical protein